MENSLVLILLVYLISTVPFTYEPWEVPTIEPLWSANVSGHVRSIDIIDDYVAVYSKDNHTAFITLFNPQGDRLWSHTFDNISWGDLAIFNDKIVFAGDSVFLLLSRQGNTVLKLPFNESVYRIDVQGDRILVFTSTAVYVFNGTDFEKIIHTNITPRFVDFKRDIIVACNFYGSKVVVFDFSGKLLWENHVKGHITDIDYKDGVIALCERWAIDKGSYMELHGHVKLYDYKGRQIWNRKSDEAWSVSFGNDFVAVGSSNVELYSIPGELKWKEGFGVTEFSVEVKDGLIAGFITGKWLEMGGVFVFNKWGKPLFAYTTDRIVSAYYFDGKRVIFGDGRGRVYYLEVKDLSSPLWYLRLYWRDILFLTSIYLVGLKGGKSKFIVLIMGVGILIVLLFKFLFGF